MSPESLDRVYASLEEAEGFVARPYPDRYGYLTMGIGHRIDGGAIPISRKAALAILEGDVAEMERRCQRRVITWKQIDEIRQAALLELAFNGTLFASPRALAAVDMGDWHAAADEFLSGPWKEQVGLRRAGRLTEQLRTGTWAT